MTTSIHRRRPDRILHCVLAMAFLLVMCTPAKAQQSYLDSLATLNNPGTMAADFALITTDGNTGTLYEREAPMTLIYLYHPDCYECVATINYLMVNTVFKSMIEKGRIEALAVDLTEDMVSITQNLRPPKGWTLCFNYDAKIINEILYYIEHYPSMYLLDRDKKVILKNPEPAGLLEYLENL